MSHWYRTFSLVMLYFDVITVSEHYSVKSHLNVLNQFNTQTGFPDYYFCTKMYFFFNPLHSFNMCSM